MMEVHFGRNVERIKWEMMFGGGGVTETKSRGQKTQTNPAGGESSISATLSIPG